MAELKLIYSNETVTFGYEANNFSVLQDRRNLSTETNFRLTNILADCF